MRTPIHPGEYIVDAILEADMSIGAAAEASGIHLDVLRAVCRGERGITVDVADGLSEWLGTTPHLWLNLQSRYEERLRDTEN